MIAYHKHHVQLILFHCRYCIAIRNSLSYNTNMELIINILPEGSHNDKHYDIYTHTHTHTG